MRALSDGAHFPYDLCKLTFAANCLCRRVGEGLPPGSHPTGARAKPLRSHRAEDALITTTGWDLT